MTLIIFLALIGLGIYVGITWSKQPDPEKLKSNFVAYIENISSAGKLVLVEARQRLVITETTTGYLFGNTKLGRFLGIKSDAIIEASALADITFVVDLYPVESWSIVYDNKNGLLTIKAPPLAILTPAILSDTIEIKAVEKSIFLNEDKLGHEAIKRLTDNFIVHAQNLLTEPTIREKALVSLENIVAIFASKLGLKQNQIIIQFN